MNMTQHRRRILAALEQRGPTHRQHLSDLFEWRTPTVGPQAITRTVGRMMRPLIDAGLVTERRERAGYHMHYAITDSGKRRLREGASDA